MNVIKSGHYFERIFNIKEMANNKKKDMTGNIEMKVIREKERMKKHERDQK